jgi:hypothetical protein
VTPPVATPIGPLPAGWPDPIVPGVPVGLPTVVQSTASFIPELGQSITTAEQKDFQRLAIHIVSMMELPW